MKKKFLTAVLTALLCTSFITNIAGAATAIAIGGPGAIFWMWIAAFLGMATIYAEDPSQSKDVENYIENFYKKWLYEKGSNRDVPFSVLNTYNF